MPFSKSQVYAELSRLELLRMVEGTEVPQDRLRRFARFGEFLKQAPATHYHRITVLFGRKFAEAAGEWTEEAQALLPGEQDRTGPRRPAPQHALELLLAGPTARRPGGERPG